MTTQKTPENEPKVFNTKAERLLLEFIIQSEELALIAEPELRVEDFNDPTNKKVVSFIKDYLAQWRVPPIKHFIATATNVAMNEIGAPGFVIGKDEATIKRNVAFFLNEFQEFITNRSVGDAIQDAFTEYSAGNYGVINDIIDKASRRQLVKQKVGINLGADLQLIREGMVERSANMISTGYPKLDKEIGGGLPRGTMSVFAARSGVGKSLTLANLCYNLAFAGYKVLYVTAEMSELDISLRFMQMVSGMKTMGADIDGEHADKIIAGAQGRQWTQNITTVKLPEGARTPEILSLVRAGDYDVVAVDYMCLIACADINIDQGNKHLSDAKTAGELRHIAETENVALITASQMTKPAGNKRPGDSYVTEDVGGGVGKTQKCDNLIILEKITNADEMKDNPYLKPKVYGYRWWITKTRNGQCNGHFLDMKWDWRYLRIHELADGDTLIDDGDGPSPKKATAPSQEPLIAPETDDTDPGLTQETATSKMLETIRRKSSFGD